MAGEVRRVPPHAMSEELVLSKLRYLTDVQLWPITPHVDPLPWLDNFTPEERPYAVHILNVFLYLSDPIVDAIFLSTVHFLSSAVTARTTSLADAQSRWRHFLSTARVTYVQGEHPSPTDSGHLFVRKARQLLSIPEDRIWIQVARSTTSLTIPLHPCSLSMILWVVESRWSVLGRENTPSDIPDGSHRSATLSVMSIR